MMKELPRWLVLRSSVAHRSAARNGSGKNIEPSLAPLKGCADEILERGAVEQVVQRPKRRGMSDEEDTCPIELGGKIIQEVLDTFDDLPIAFSLSERVVDVARTLSYEARHG
jgi:hypothetical protein